MKGDVYKVTIYKVTICRQTGHTVLAPLQAAQLVVIIVSIQRHFAAFDLLYCQCNF